MLSYSLDPSIEPPISLLASKELAGVRDQVGYVQAGGEAWRGPPTWACTSERCIWEEGGWGRDLAPLASNELARVRVQVGYVEAWGEAWRVLLTWAGTGEWCVWWLGEFGRRVVKDTGAVIPHASSNISHCLFWIGK